MSLRTDLALELTEKEANLSGVYKKTEREGDIETTCIIIKNKAAEERLQKKRGKYITVSFPPLCKIADYENLKQSIIKALEEIVPKNAKSILVVGLGNTEITPDSVGPFAAQKIFATRHISGAFAENMGLNGLRCVSVITPSVLGKTGIESAELIKSAAKTVCPDVLLVIDSLASLGTERLFRTVQLSNTGISPGSGVKNSRKEISEETIGKKVIAIGVPTVVDAEALAFELTGSETNKSFDMLVTPKEVDLLVGRISEILALSLNRFLQPDLSEDIIADLV